MHLEISRPSICQVMWPILLINSWISAASINSGPVESVGTYNSESNTNIVHQITMKVKAINNKTHTLINIASPNNGGSIALNLYVDNDEPRNIQSNPSKPENVPSSPKVNDNLHVNSNNYVDPFDKFLIYNETGTLYHFNKYGQRIRGPCGKFMELEQESEDSEYIVCKCITPKNNNCRTRPLVYWEKTKRCYYGFDQGPCSTTEWLINDENGSSTCQINPCPLPRYPLNEDHKNSTYNFAFVSHDGKCYKTDTQAFCANKKFAYFVDDDTTPRCIPKLSEDCSAAFSSSVARPRPCPRGTVSQSDGGCARIVSFGG